MLIYWLMFAVPSLFATVEQPRRAFRERFDMRWLFAAVALIVIIGLRWDTGGDWGNYNLLVQQAIWDPKPLTILGEPAFNLVTRYAAHSAYGMLVVTMASALIVAFALLFFCLDQPRPWLCMSVAVPYFVVVLGMGYIRQGIAISFLLLGLNALRHGRVLRYELLVLAGAMFHATAFLLVPLGLFVSTTNLVVRSVLAAVTMVMLAYVVSSTRADVYLTNYVDAEMTSSGAAIRLLMTAIPAGVYLIFRDRFALPLLQQRVWTVLCWAGLAMLPMLVILPSSTVVDRLGLYLLPVQCFVYARLPGLFAASEKNERLIAVGILMLYALIFFVWLNYAANVNMWLPYRSWLFEDGICLDC